MKNYKYSSDIMLVPISLIQRHDVIVSCGERKLDDFLEKELWRYDIKTLPISVEDKANGIFFVVKNYHLVKKAKEDGKQDLQLMRVNCPVGEAPRLYNFSVPITSAKNYNETYKSMDYLNRYMSETPEGKQFYRDLPGKHKRDKISYLHGYREGSMFTKIITIGKFAPSLLNDLDEGSVRLDDAYEKAVVIRREQDEEKASLAASTPPQRLTESAIAEPPIAWSSNCSAKDVEHFSNSLAIPRFDLEPPLVDKVKMQTKIIQTSGGTETTTIPSKFYHPSFTILAEGIGLLEVEWSSRDVFVKLDGISKAGYQHIINESPNLKTIQLYYKDQLVASLTYNINSLSQ